MWVGKLKNTEGSVPIAIGIGLLVVQLLYRFYVFGHLSKWFVFALMLKFLPVCRLVNGRPTIGYNVSGIAEGGIFSTKVQSKNES